MIKKLLITTILVTTPFLSHATGKMVFDKLNYALNSKEIQKLEQGLSYAQDQVEKLHDIKDKLTGNLKINVKLAGKLGEFKDSLVGIADTMNDLSYIKNMGLDFDPKDLKDILKSQKGLFANASSNFKKYYETSKDREQYKQNTLKNMLAYSEFSLQQYEQTIETMKELAMQADMAQTMAEKQDISNRIALETLSSINQLVMMIGYASKIQSIEEYDGSGEGIAEEIQVLENNKKITNEKATNNFNSRLKKMAPSNAAERQEFKEKTGWSL